MNYGAVILAGGQSRRMGLDKAGLRLNGVRFVDKLVFELSGFQELLVSVDHEENHPDMEYPMVSDIFFNCGPMGGLYAALMGCASDALVTVPCDVPLFSKAMADELCSCLDPDTDAVITIAGDGRVHPLCGVYRKSCLPVLEQSLREQNCRMQDCLKKLKVKEYQAGKDSWRLKNINTPEDFAALKQRSCLAVCGWKNAGKTTLIEKLIPLLTAEGLKIAAVKHDGHCYEPDVPGKDSCRFFQAGASTSLIYDSHKYSLTSRRSIADEEAVDLAPEADIVLLEGFKWTGYPKIEIIRRANGKPPIPGLKGRIAYVSDMELNQDLPVLQLDNVRRIGTFIMEAYKNGSLKRRTI